jgi:hypothetical protein
MKTFVCDLDGVLLQSGKVFAKKWSEILGVDLTEDAFTCWIMEWALGVDPKLNDRFWSEVWDLELEPYPDAGWFVHRIKSLGYRFVVLTSRMASEKARKSVYRDIWKITYNGVYEIDDIIVCDTKKGEMKSKYIHDIPDAEYFVDDHLKNVIDVKVNCPKLKEVFLMDRPWNRSLDLAKYERVFSYGDILESLVFWSVFGHKGGRR